MKYIKIIFSIIIIIILLFVINYLRINIYYQSQKPKYIETFKVQGNKDNYVPQGLAYSSKYNIALQTSYNSKHTVSKLYITDLNTNKLIKELKLKELDASDNVNHVGGITTDNIRVWITNDYEVNEYILEDILNTNEDYIQSIKNTKLPIRGDFCKYHDNTLWIGDFFLNPFYKVPDNNPLLLAYNTEEEIDYNNPYTIISLPKMVQGMEITKDNKFIFTTSFTYLINSELLIYDNVLTSNSKIYKLNGKDIPYYKFSNPKIIKLPPMAEGMFYKDNYLYILFENSSDSYKPAIPKLKRIIKLNIKNI